MSRLIALRTENVKRLSAVELVLGEESLFIVGGKNGNGKSSTLDSIAMVLGGKELAPEVPIRRGETEAAIEAEIKCDDGVTLIVTRKFRARDTAGYTSTLEVKEKTARGFAKLSGAQGILDAMCSRFTFDPLAFTRMKPADQLATVKEIVGVNTDALDAAIDLKFRERTEVNRRLKELDAQASSATTHEEVGETEVSVSQLSNQLREAGTANQRADALQRQADTAQQSADRAASQIVQLRQQLATLEAEHLRQALLAADATEVAASAGRVDTAPILHAIEAAESINRKVRDNVAAKLMQSQADDTRKAADQLTSEIEALRQEKMETVANAQWPVEGMGFGEGCVTFNGLPLNQASQAETIKVCCRLGFALTRELPVLLIREGSLLDEDSLAAAEQIAEECGGQIILEKVTNDAGACSVLIVDGKVDSGARARTSDAVCV